MVSQDPEQPPKEVPELDPGHLEILQQGVEVWNEWIEHSRGITPLLAGANLAEADLEGAILSGAHLEGADLTGARLKGAFLDRAYLDDVKLLGAHLEEASLQEAHLEGADLYGAHLEGASVRGADLDGANVEGVHFDNADLGQAKLIGSKALIGGQLAGTDVTGAQLPKDIAEFESLKVADEAAKNSRSLFLIMLLGCVYSWLALATTSDAALIMNTGSSPLPIIRVPVPIVGFYLAAPTFLLGAYVYFHLYLHGLWVSLSNLPAIFPDGRPLDQRAYPWLLTSLVRPNFKLLQDQKSRYSIATVWLSVFLAWWVVPITLYLFWAQALAAHVWYMTAAHLFLFTTSVFAGVHLYQSAVETLRLKEPEPVRIWRFVWQVTTTRKGVVPIGMVVLVFLSWMALWGPIRLPKITPLFHPYAELVGAQLSIRMELAFSGDTPMVQPAHLAGRNLRFADLSLAVLTGANLTGANLTGADLSFAALTEANLTGANLTGADLSFAALTEANLTEANLTGADLTLAVLPRANLTEANLTEANLTGARLLGANLTGANLTVARLLGANLTGAELTAAELTGADLHFAELTGVDLTTVQGWTNIRVLEYANLFDTRAPEGFWTFAADADAVCMNPAVADSAFKRLREYPPPFTASEDGSAPPECVP